VDLIGWELLEPSAGGVGEEERQLSDDGSIVASSASQMTGQPEVRQPQFRFGLSVVLRDAGRGSERAGQRCAADCPAEHPWAWWLWSHPIFITVVPPTAMGTVTALFHVPVLTASIFFNVTSRVVPMLIVDRRTSVVFLPRGGGC